MLMQQPLQYDNQAIIVRTWEQDPFPKRQQNFLDFSQLVIETGFQADNKVFELPVNTIYADLQHEVNARYAAPMTMLYFENDDD